MRVIARMNCDAGSTFLVWHVAWYGYFNILEMDMTIGQSIQNTVKSMIQGDSGAPDAISLLKADHREAQALFDRYEEVKDSASPEEKLEIAKEVCGALLIHMAIEEAIFYPTARERIDDDELLNEAEVEHDGAKDLIQQLGELKSDDPMFDAKIKVLGEQIKHHIEEEESELFPEVAEADIDLNTLGEQLLTAKNKMREEHGLPPQAPNQIKH